MNEYATFFVVDNFAWFPSNFSSTCKNFRFGLHSFLRIQSFDEISDMPSPLRLFLLFVKIAKNIYRNLQ